MGDIISPRIQHLEGSFSIVQGVPTVHQINWNDRSHVGIKDRGGGNNGRDYRDCGRNDTSWAQQERPCPQRNPGRLAHPDRNHRPFLPNIQCAACKRIGHVAKHCDMLATAICLERYMKRDMSNSVQDAIKKDWLARWKDHLENPDCTPCQVLHAYVEELDITVARLDDAMEWDCWADKDNSVSFDNSDE
jgi:hypothetical protein